jgi:hypothetical protein
VIIGTATLNLLIPAARSLKDRRRAVKAVVARVQSRFSVAIAEVGDLETWNAATLGVACVSNDAAHAHQVLQRVVRFIEDGRLDVELADYHIEII